MGFWEIAGIICKIPLGIAAICLSVIIGMIAFIGCSLICYCFWAITFGRQTDSIFRGQDEE